LNVQGNVALMTVVRLDTGNVGSFRVTDNGPGALDLVEGNFGPGCPDAQAFYFDLGCSAATSWWSTRHLYPRPTGP
jgi:hypothetical protein